MGVTVRVSRVRWGHSVKMEEAGCDRDHMGPNKRDFRAKDGREQHLQANVNYMCVIDLFYYKDYGRSDYSVHALTTPTCSLSGPHCCCCLEILPWLVFQDPLL